MRTVVLRLGVLAAAALAFGVHVERARDAALHTSLRATLERVAPGFLIDTLGPPAALPPIPARLRLIEDAAAGDQTTTLRAAAVALRIDDRWQAVKGGVIVSVGGSLPSRRGLEWTAGRMVVAPLAFRRPARYLNDGVGDFERDLAFEGTTLFASVKSGLLVEPVSRSGVVEEWAARVRRRVRRSVVAWVAPRDQLAAAITTAVLIGDRSGLPDEIRQRLQAAGTYHVIAISGGNIAILAAVVVALLHLFGLAGRWSAGFAIVMLLAYAQVVTAGASVWRATAMACLYFGVRFFDLRTPPWRALIVTAVVMLWLRPLDLRDAGFLLTFGATAALVEVARRYEPRFRRLRPPVRWIAASVAATLAVEVTLLPIGARIFSRVGLAGIVLNLLAVPAMTVLQLGGLVVVAADRIGWLAAVAAPAVVFASRLLVDSARLVDVLPWLSVRIPPPGVTSIAAYYACLALMLTPRPGLRRAGCAGLVVVVGAAAWKPSSAADITRLRLTAFDVGQGDSFLLQAPGGAALLVDTGGAPFGTGFDIGGRVLAPALWARGVRRLDALLVTHGDPDHLGGARAVLADFTVRELWEGIEVPRHRPSVELEADAAKRGIPLRRHAEGEELAFGAARIRVLHPPPAEWERQRVRNDDSVVLEVLYRDVAILLTGDITAAVERDIVPRLIPARIRVLKVAHHGSRTSSSQQLLDAWRPQIAIVSAGRGNTFGHPAPDVAARIQATGARLYRTDRDGEVTLETDGQSVEMKTAVVEK